MISKLKKRKEKEKKKEKEKEKEKDEKVENEVPKLSSLTRSPSMRDQSMVSSGMGKTNNSFAVNGLLTVTLQRNYPRKRLKKKLHPLKKTNQRRDS